MNALMRARLQEVLSAIAPLVLMVCLLQVTLVHAPLEQFLQFLLGSVIATVGMLLLFAGIDLGIVPMGRYVGAELPTKGSLTRIVAVAFALAFATTVAEPDVLVLAAQIDQVSRGMLSGITTQYAIAIGLGVFAAVAMARIVLGWSMRAMLTGAYVLMLVLALVAPPSFVSVAFDAGSVTTGVLSAPVVIALAVGLSSVLAGRSAVSDGFGILGFASIGPIVMLLLMGLVQR